MVTHDEKERGSKRANNCQEHGDDDVAHGAQCSRAARYASVPYLVDAMHIADIAENASMVRWQFRPRLVTTLATAAFTAMTIGAGLWQLERASQKIERQRAFESGQAADRLDLNRDAIRGTPTTSQPVRAFGEFLSSDTVYIDNRMYRGKPGFHVVTPFRIIDSRRIVLVNRGWTPLDVLRHEPLQVVTVSGALVIEGLLSTPSDRPFELGTPDLKARIWPNLTIERFTLGRGIPIEPYLVLQTSDTPDGLVRAWEPPASGAEKNQAYAIQWFAFAALAIMLYVGLNLHKKRNDARP